MNHHPIATSGPREPAKPQPIPKAIRAAIELMICGRPDDINAAPLSMIEACAASGIKPYVMRRALDKPRVIAYLRSERRAFREAICCGNEAALKRVRDESQNGMVTVASVRALEGIADADTASPGQVSAGVTIRIINAPRPIDVTPSRGVIEHDPQR
jgi:hypothetical protein